LVTLQESLVRVPLKQALVWRVLVKPLALPLVLLKVLACLVVSVPLRRVLVPPLWKRCHSLP
jgi:hypothetical protein